MTNILKIGTDTIYGKIYAEKIINGETYYFIMNKNRAILMAPQSVLEKELS